MKIRTDFVSNSSSSAFVVYKVNDKHVCSKKELTDFIIDGFGKESRYSHTFLDELSSKNKEWLSMMICYSQKFKSWNDHEKCEKSLVNNYTVEELRAKYLEILRKEYGDDLFDRLVSGYWYFTVIGIDDFKSMHKGRKGFNDYKRFLELESQRHYCCNDFDDEMSHINNALDSCVFDSMFNLDYKLREIRDIDRKIGDSLIKAFDGVKKISEKSREKVWDCYFFQETDYVVMFGENVIDEITGMCDDSKDEILDEIKFVVSFGDADDKVQHKVNEVTKLIKKHEDAKYETPGYSIARIGELIANRFNIPIKESRDNWITVSDIVSGCHHMG